MMDSESIRFIREEIRRQVAIILSGVSGDNSEMGSEDIDDLFPGMDTFLQRPVMHPYGFASRAPKGTIQVTGRQGEHPLNRMVLGHRDKDRPEDLESGEAVLYAADGTKIYVRKTKVQIGSEDADEPLVLGNVTLDALGAILDQLDSALEQIITGPVAISSAPGNPAPTFPALITSLTATRAAIATLRSQYLTTPATNIVSQVAFTQRSLI